MSDDINKMDFKQLRNEVQLLRDELAIMKRKYEDTIYNLDTDNFSSRFVKEQGDMRAAIEVTAEGIKTKVSKEDLDNSLSNYSTIEQTADKITSTVTKSFVTNLIDGEYVTDAMLQSQIKQSAEGIYLSVSKEYETKDDAQEAYDALDSYISSVSIEADSVSSRVTNLETFKTSVFTQTADGFTLDGEQTTFTGCVFLTDNDDNKAFSIFLNEDDTEYDSFIMWGYGDYTTTPIILGNTYGQNVYIGQYVERQMVATRGWVLDNAGSGSGGPVVAVFGPID